MGMILRIASSRIVGQGDIVGRSGYFSLNLSANSVMRGRLDARRTLKSLVADLRFYWFYPSPCSHSKFGLEKINGVAKGIPFNEEELKKYSDMAAEVLNVPIYGGDCVVSADGELKIIDFNDWPSFARCREEAGVKIAECIYNRVKKKQMKK